MAPGGRASEVRADLDEIHRFERQRRGAFAAWRRYWGEALGLISWRVRASRSSSAGSFRAGIDGLAQDVRLGARALHRRPGISVVAVLTLAMGIGLSTSMFTLLEAVVLRPLSFPQAERVVRLRSVVPDRGPNFVSGPDFLHWRERLTTAVAGDAIRPFTELAAFQFWNPTVVTDRGGRLVPGARVSPWFFRALGVEPVLGRDFLAVEDGGVESGVVILSHGLWQEVFGEDPGIIGRQLEVPPSTFRVVGVLPPDLSLPAGRQLWTPLDLRAAPWMLDRSVRPFLVFGRLAAGVTADAAEERLGQLAGSLAEEYPETNEGVSAIVEPLKETVLEGVERPLLMLLGAVGLVLLIACTNVANLMLASGAARRRELGMYLALGASRGRVVRRLLVESLLVAILGGALGLAASYASLGFLRGIVPGFVPRAEGLTVDVTVLGFALLITGASALLAGLIPAWNAVPASGGGVVGSREAANGSEDRSGSRVADGLLVAEFALTAVLLVGAGLLLRSVLSMGSVDPGMRVEGIQTFRVSYPGDTDPGSATRAILESLGSLPGVERAAATTRVPLSGHDLFAPVTIEGDEGLAAQGPEISVHLVSPGLMQQLGRPLLAGRHLRDSDGAGARRVALVNEMAARRHWPDGSAVGGRLYLADQYQRFDADAWIEIVGVVGDVRHHGPAEDPVPELYVPYAQARVGGVWNWSSGSIAFLVAGERPITEAEIRETVRGVGAAIPVYGLSTLEEVAGAWLSRTRFAASLLQLFSGLSLVLAAVGIYGVATFAVRRRGRDIGVRMALGASRARVLRQVLGRSLRTALAGSAVGILLAYAASRFVAHLLHGVGRFDLQTSLAALALLAVVTVAAAFVPARRAASVDPARTLREG